MVETLLEAYVAGWRIRARCLGVDRRTPKSTRDCAKSIDLDLGTLLWTRGGPLPLSDLQGKLRCPWCGSRRMIVSYQPPQHVNEVSPRLRR